MSNLHEMINPGLGKVFQDPAFRLTLDTHREFFLTSGNYEIHMVQEHEALMYRNDLTGYLTSVNIPLSHHYIIMRMNRMTSPVEFNMAKHRALLTPSDQAFSEVIQRHITSFGQAV